MQGFTYEKAQFFNDKDEMLFLVRVKKAFQSGTVYHPAGAIRLWSSKDENDMIEHHARAESISIDEATKFLADHFESVEIRNYFK